MYGENINILFNYDTNFYHVMKMSLNFWYLNSTISFESYMLLLRVRNQKTTINIKVRAIEQIFVFDPKL